MPQTLDITPAEAEELRQRFRDDPQFFFTSVLGCDLWEKQLQIALSVRDNRETTTRSCHGIGKTFVAARIIAWYLISHPGSVVITTAPTFRQVRELLWREINTAFNRSKYVLGPKPNQVSWELDTDWFALGLSTTEPDKFQGYHSSHLLVVIDEAAGVDEAIFEAIRGVTTSSQNRILYLGNPTSTFGTFFDSHKSDTASKIHISAWDTPNFTANGIAKCTTPDEQCTNQHHPVESLIAAMESGKELLEPYDKLISPVWVFERYHEWGFGSPMWDSRIEGDFPAQGENTLMSQVAIEQCMDRDWLNEHGFILQDGPPEHSLDVARFGSDKTVMTTRRGNRVFPQRIWGKVDLVFTAGKVHQMLDPMDIQTKLYIDVIGLGTGVVDNLTNAKSLNSEWYNVYGINVGMPAEPDPERAKKLLKRGLKFANLRARLYWELAGKVNNHEIWLPKDSTLANELATITYRYMPDGTIYIPTKEEIKKETNGKSPDRADSLMLSFAGPQYGEFTRTDKIQRTSSTSGRPHTAGLLSTKF